MDHPTSRWARLYGLPDPGEPAQAALDARPEQVRGLAAILGHVSQGTDAGRRLAGAAGEALRAGWSTPTALLAVQSVAAAARGVADTCAGAGRACAGFAGEMDRAQAALRRAYADADARIVTAGLAFEGLGPPWGALGIIRERCAVVTALHATVTEVTGRLDDAALTLVTALDANPLHGLAAMPSATVSSEKHGSAAGTDARNRALLVADLSSASIGRRMFARGVREALEGAGRPGDPVQLLVYDPSRPGGQGSAAIAVGDVGRADQVAVLVPGVGNSPADAAPALGAAGGLADAATAAAPGTRSAVVVWLGYDVPASWRHDPAVVTGPAGLIGDLADTALALDDAGAAAAGPQLAGFTRRLRTMMDPTAALTLVGHSYGSTVVSQAAVDLGPDSGVDDIVLLASPGAGPGPSHAGDYRAVPADHVYTLAFPADPVPAPTTDLAASLLGALTVGRAGSPFGADPHAPDFGAQIIDAPSSVPVAHGAPNPLVGLLTGGLVGPLDLAGIDPAGTLNQHPLGNYLGGAALAAVAAVVAGRYARVPVRRRR